MADNHNYQDETFQPNEQLGADEINDVQAQLKKLREDLSALAGMVTTIGKEKAAVYGAKVANDAIEASQEAIEGVHADYVSLEQAVSDRIRARPIQAMGVAVGIGYLIAAMRRR